MMPDCSCVRDMYKERIQCPLCTYCMSIYYGIQVILNNIMYVTKFYKTDPNLTSSKIKLTPCPVDSYTTSLLALIVSKTQTTQG